ncbi:MAG: patatin-like phospholipase family protein [Planctomycetota bacterium]|jgi:hypothetical protein
MSDSHGPLEPSRSPLDWKTVWSAELDQIRERRNRQKSASQKNAADSSRDKGRGDNADAVPLEPDGGQNGSEGQNLADVEQRATSENLVGLAFSGGGIRSATFNLGILQGLAEFGLLKHFDYLSTVSGGGYIGGWFSALVQRLGSLDEAEKVLQKIRRKQPKFDYPDEDVQSAGSDKEPEPVAHLRAYSNYLAPHFSLFSQDTLSLVAAYLRNLVASLLVILPALIGVICLMRLLHAAFIKPSLACIPCSIPVAITLITASVVAALLQIGFALRRIRDVRRHQEGEQVPRDRRMHLQPGIYTVIVSLLVGAAAISSWLLSRSQHVPQLAVESPTGPQVSMLTSISAFAILSVLCYLIQEALQEFNTFKWGSLIARLAGGIVGGALIACTVEWLFWKQELMDQSVDFILGVPCLLCSWVVASKIELALAGRAVGEDEREWWGRLAAALTQVSIVWLTSTSVVILGPILLEHLGDWISRTLTVGWIASTAGGLFAARSQKSARPGALRKLALACVPYVFVIGLACGLALATSSTIDASNDQYEAAVGEMSIAARMSHIEDYLQHVSLYRILVLLGACILLGGYVSRRVDINATSQNGLYANRLTRCYLGASRAKERGSEAFGRPVNHEKPRRQPHPWTDFDPLDDLALYTLQPKPQAGRQPAFDGPFHLFNTVINLAGGNGLGQRDRNANSFTLTPLACGNPRIGFRPTQESDCGHVRGYAGGLTVGRAMAISGAAVNSGMGEHTSPALSALMTIFNVRLGWWAGNPLDCRRWMQPGPRWALNSLLVEMLSGTDNEHGFVNLSDGGHFENLGGFELVRRRCRYIVVVDAGADPDYEFADLGNLVRKCRIDLGIEIEIDIDPMRPNPETGKAQWHCAVGRVRYDWVDPRAALGTLVYLKPVLTGDEPPDLTNYARQNSRFPQQPTVDQFFNESQFESYRELGHHTVWAAFSEAATAMRS